jgi:hypothetical protein
MFARVKKSGSHQYLQIVENKKVDGKSRQRVIATVGRLDEINAKGRIEPLIQSLSRFSEKTLMVLSGQSEPDVEARKIGPALIFERLWKETGIKRFILEHLSGRGFVFDVERAIFLTVLHRLMVSGSDRFCDQWRRDYRVANTEGLDLHHLYRAMGWLGEVLEDQGDATPFAPRCTKDLIEESLFGFRRDLFSSLDLVFFDTTSIYFEGDGGARIGQRGFSKDHRPDLNQMVVGAVIDDTGMPICCEMWPGNTADVKTLLPVLKRLRKRFSIRSVCIVADRGMISDETLKVLEDPKEPIPYILGVRMRRNRDVRLDVLGTGGRYQEVYPEPFLSHEPAPLKVKEVRFKGTRYIVCVNTRQARKDAHAREGMLEDLKEKLTKGPKSLIGNKGYRRYLSLDRGGLRIDEEKIKAEAKFDGKWVLRTNTTLATAQVALKYKELWQVERTFRDMKTLLATRPVYHHKDENIRGHVFCSFLALVLRKELERRLNAKGHEFEWSQIKQDLKALQTVTIEDNGKRIEVRSRCEGICAQIFQSCGVAIPPTIREV